MAPFAILYKEAADLRDYYFWTYDSYETKTGMLIADSESEAWLRVMNYLIQQGYDDAGQFLTVVYKGSMRDDGILCFED